MSIKIDLFKLIDKEEKRPGSWVMASGKELNKALKPLINKASLKFGSKSKFRNYLTKKFGFSKATGTRFIWLMKDWHSLFLIKEVADLTRVPYFDIQSKIDYLKMNQPPLKVFKAVKELNSDLCKFVGAHAADGTLYKSFIKISDGYKTNLIVLRKWIKNIFGVEYNIKKVKGSKEWGISFHSGIIARYLNKIFGFPSGDKQYTVSEPKIIKNAALKFRKNFALGALTFEAGIGIRHQVALCVASKNFSDSISEILNLFNIKHTKMERQSGGYWKLWSGKLSKEETREWMEFFEPRTEKWFLLNDYLKGYKGTCISFEDATERLDKIYPFKSASKVCLKDIMIAIKKLHKTYRYELASYLCENKNLNSFGGKWANSLSPYLNILKNVNMIEVNREKFGKKKSFGSILREVYTFNPNVHEWKLPVR